MIVEKAVSSISYKTDKSIEEGAKKLIVVITLEVSEGILDVFDDVRKVLVDDVHSMENYDNDPNNDLIEIHEA